MNKSHVGLFISLEISVCRKRSEKLLTHQKTLSFLTTLKMPLGAHPFDKLSLETTKDYKLYKVYQQLKNEMAGQKKSQEASKTKDVPEKTAEPEELKTEHGTVEFVWEGDV